MIDLHSHSTASDGTLSPSLLLRHAKDRGLQVLALTDHDTTDGVPEAQEAAVLHNIRLIAGAEFEILWERPGTFHLLALNIDPKHKKILNLIKKAKEERTERNERIMKNFDKIGLTIDWVAFRAQHSLIGRPHFAELLVGEGRAKDIQDAFNQFLTPGKPLYEPRRGLYLDEALEATHAAGGRAFVAHPHSLHLGWEELFRQLSAMKDQGLDGLEAWHPGITRHEAQRLMDLSQKIGLKMSAGSDFHGDSKPDRLLGKSLKEKYTIDDEFLACIES